MEKTEIPYLVLCALVLGYCIALVYSISFSTSFTFLSMFKYALIALAILSINLVAKKLAALKLGCAIRAEPSTWRRFGFPESSYFRWPFPSWIIWPLVFTGLSLGRFFWLSNMNFEVEPLPARAARKFSELTEFDIGLIAAAGIAANLFAAVIAAAFHNLSFTYLNLWFAFFNILPFPAYDGGKILFADKLFFVFMFTFTLIMLILLHVAGIITTIISAFLLAIIAAFVFYGLREK